VLSENVTVQCSSLLTQSLKDFRVTAPIKFSVSIEDNDHRISDVEILYKLIDIKKFKIVCSSFLKIV